MNINKETKGGNETSETAWICHCVGTQGETIECVVSGDAGTQGETAEGVISGDAGTRGGTVKVC